MINANIFNCKKYLIIGILLLSCVHQKETVLPISNYEKRQHYCSEAKKAGISYCLFRFRSYYSTVYYLFMIIPRYEGVFIIRISEDDKDDFIQTFGSWHHKMLDLYLKEVDTNCVHEILSKQNPIGPIFDVIEFYNSETKATEEFIFSSNDYPDRYLQMLSDLKSAVLDIEVGYPRNKGFEYSSIKFPIQFTSLK